MYSSYKGGDDMSEIGKFIKEIRLENNMNITQLAEQSGVSRPYLSQIESGKRNPSNDLLFKLSKALDISYALLLEKTGDKDQAEAMRNSESAYNNLIKRIVEIQENDSIGEFIRAIRLALNYSIDDVAKTTELPTSTLKSIEANNKNRIDKETLYRISIHYENDLLNIFSALLQVAGIMEYPDHSYIDLLYDKSNHIQEAEKLEEILIQNRFRNKSFIELLQEKSIEDNTFQIENVLSNKSEVYFEDQILTEEEKNSIYRFIKYILIEDN